MDRFWSRVDKDGACWEWAGARHPQGYGVFSAGGRSLRAHRFAFQLANGPIPEGMFVLHSCDNPPCVNPAHLRLGSHADNMRDMSARRRHTNSQKTECLRGHPLDAGNTYITPRGFRNCRTCRTESVRALRARRKAA